MQLAQAVHAGTQFVLEHPELARYWEEVWKNLVCLQVRDEDELLNCWEDIRCEGVTPTIFIEPDLNDERTSLASLLTEQQAKKFKRLSLSLRTSPKGGEA